MGARPAACARRCEHRKGVGLRSCELEAPDEAAETGRWGQSSPGRRGFCDSRRETGLRDLLPVHRTRQELELHMQLAVRRLLGKQHQPRGRIVGSTSRMRRRVPEVRSTRRQPAFDPGPGEMEAPNETAETGGWDQSSRGRRGSRERWRQAGVQHLMPLQWTGQGLELELHVQVVGRRLLGIHRCLRGWILGDRLRMLRKVVTREKTADG